MTTTERYTRTAIWMHWIIAILILFLLFPGHEFIEVDRGQSLAGWGPSAHASLGILVLLLSFIRLGWRLANPPPRLPATMPEWQKFASHGLHWAFYALMIGLPISGWFALSPFGAARLDPEAVTFFMLFSLYLMPNLGGWTMEAHEIAGTIAKAMIALHVLAPLKHQFWDKDGLLRRMAPF